MPIVKIVEGDLLNAEEEYLCQQCNCVTKKSAGLARSIAKRYPYADIYKTREKPDSPGSITISYGEKNIIHLFAQYQPGKRGDKETRINWFKQCLEKLDQLELKIVAMPYLIGCGLAGGDWSTYESMLNAAKTEIVLYKYNG